jgi:hypothetical protein
MRRVSGKRILSEASWFQTPPSSPSVLPAGQRLKFGWDKGRRASSARRLKLESANGKSVGRSLGTSKRTSSDTAKHGGERPRREHLCERSHATSQSCVKSEYPIRWFFGYVKRRPIFFWVNVHLSHLIRCISDPKYAIVAPAGMIPGKGPARFCSFSRLARRRLDV